MSDKNKKQYKNYKRPKKTFTDRLTDEQISKLLDGYIKVDNIVNVPLNTHIRYFTFNKDEKTNKVEKEFKTGGFLMNRDAGQYPRYVILSNGNVNWSVQVDSTVFYKQLSIDEIKESYQEEIDKITNAYEKLYKQNKKFKEEFKRRGIDYHKF